MVSSRYVKCRNCKLESFSVLSIHEERPRHRMRHCVLGRVRVLRTHIDLVSCNEHNLTHNLLRPAHFDWNKKNVIRKDAETEKRQLPASSTSRSTMPKVNFDSG